MDVFAGFRIRQCRTQFLYKLCLFVFLLVIAGFIIKEVCNEIQQNLNGANRPQTEWNIKIRAQNMKRRCKYYSKYIKGGTGGKTQRKLKRIASGFWKLVSLTVFQLSSFLLFVTFWYNIWETNFVWHEAVILLFTSFFTIVTFHSEDGRTIGNLKKWNRQPWH